VALEHAHVVGDLVGVGHVPRRDCVVLEHLRVQGAGCRVQGAGCRVQGSGCRVQG
jgi:hypothetical protein